MANQQPTYHAWTTVKREGKDDFWIGPIGAAFMHQDGDGLTLLLQALPITDAEGQCKIVLRPPKADTKQTERDQQTVRAANDRRKLREVK